LVSHPRKPKKNSENREIRKLENPCPVSGKQPGEIYYGNLKT
jgi:hypothetical protein